jgi:hypothetical protein
MNFRRVRRCCERSLDAFQTPPVCRQAFDDRSTRDLHRAPPGWRSLEV